MPYTRPYTGGFKDYPDTTTPINATALNTMDVGIKTANDQFQTVTTAQRTALTPTVGQAVWDSDLKQLMVYMNASGGNAWQPVGNRIVCASTTRPSTPFHGQMIYETDTKKEFVYNGSAWVQTNTASTTSGVTGVSNLIVPPLVRVRRATGQSVANGTLSFVSWTVEDVDTDGCFAPTSDTVTIQTAGVYQCSISLEYAANATGWRFGCIAKNPSSASDVASAIAMAQVQAVTAGGLTTISCSSLVSCSASDTLKVICFQNSGGALDVGNTSNVNATQFSVAWIGRAS